MGTDRRFAAWLHATNPSLAYQYDALVFLNVNRPGNILIKLSKTVEVLPLTSDRDSKPPGWYRALQPDEWQRRLPAACHVRRNDQTIQVFEESLYKSLQVFSLLAQGNLRSCLRPSTNFVTSSNYRLGYTIGIFAS